MANFYHRISYTFSGCWAFVVSLTSDILFTNYVSRSIRRVVDYVVRETAARPVANIAEWRVIEIICSKSIREKLKIFGSRPRSTGALCSPML